MGLMGSMGSMGSMGARAAVTDPPRDPRVEARITGQRERLAQAPDDLGARQQLADLLSRAGDHDEAIEVLTAGRGGALDEDSMAAVARAITALARRGPRRQRSPIALCGRLGRVGMVPLLELLAQEGATGTLRLIGTEGQSAIHFVDGRLAGASNSNTARLGDLLQASSAASAAQVEALVERQRALPGHPPLGQLAIASGLIGPAPLKGLLQKQVRLALLESGRWRRAHFVFDRDERRRAGHPERDLDTETIVRDLQRMIGHVR